MACCVDNDRRRVSGPNPVCAYGGMTIHIFFFLAGECAHAGASSAWGRGHCCLWPQLGWRLMLLSGVVGSARRIVAALLVLRHGVCFAFGVELRWNWVWRGDPALVLRRGGEFCCGRYVVRGDPYLALRRGVRRALRRTSWTLAAFGVAWRPFLGVVALRRGVRCALAGVS